MPPVSGAIAWKNELYRRVKQPIVKFIQTPQSWDADELSLIKEEYLKFAKELDEYEQNKINTWVQSVT